MLDLRALHLDDHVLAGVQGGPVDLRDRRRRHRRLLEGGEDGLDRLAQVLLHDPAHRGERLGGHPVAAALELLDQVVGEHAVTGGDDLAQLDVRRAEALEGEPQTPRQPGAGRVAALAALAHRPHAQRQRQPPTGDHEPMYRWQAPAPHQLGHLGPGCGTHRVEPIGPRQGRRVDHPRRLGVAEAPDGEVRGTHQP